MGKVISFQDRKNRKTQQGYGPTLTPEFMRQLMDEAVLLAPALGPVMFSLLSTLKPKPQGVTGVDQ